MAPGGDVVTFSEWRKKEGLSLRAAAERISEDGGGSITAEQIRLMEAGAVNLKMATADLIKRGTGGEVTRLDWPETKPEAAKKGRSGA